jgi:hypothetical protein
MRLFTCYAKLGSEATFVSDPSMQVLRDFLYVDIARVRSFLAQMAEGVPQQLVTAMSDTRQRQGGVQLPPFSLQIAGTNENRTEETRSLNDSLFLLFEEAAESLGWLVDISQEAAELESWTSGDLHRRLEPSSIIRVTGSTRLVDATHFRMTLERVLAIMQTIMAFSSGDAAAATGNRSHRGQARGQSASREQLPAGISATQFKAVGSLYESLMPAGISVKVMPCGQDYPAFALSGTLLDRAEYLEPERAALFSRYGVTPSDWTIVAVVTRSKGETAAPDLSNVPSLTNADGSLDRDAFEGFAQTMLNYLEQVGMTEAPQAPAIGITPLAVYRVVPQPNAPESVTTSEAKTTMRRRWPRRRQ